MGIVPFISGQGIVCPLAWNDRRATLRLGAVKGLNIPTCPPSIRLPPSRAGMSTVAARRRTADIPAATCQSHVAAISIRPGSRLESSVTKTHSSPSSPFC